MRNLSCVGQIEWQEPNRLKLDPLYIANRGSRASTVTGVVWLGDNLVVANHRDGMRVALFDVSTGGMLAHAAVPHLNDSCDARVVAPGVWEIVLSGCWEAAFSIYRLSLNGAPRFDLIRTHWFNNRSFCHGATWSSDGKVWLSFMTGRDPRIEIFPRGKIWRLPSPWGSRGICFDGGSEEVWCVANSNTPKKTSFERTGMTIFRKRPLEEEWESFFSIEQVHGDCVVLHKGRLWVNDQYGDRLLRVDAEGKAEFFGSDMLSFPHALAISGNSILAVTNYGSSDIVFFDLNRCE